MAQALIWSQEALDDIDRIAEHISEIPAITPNRSSSVCST